ncbi:MAG: hypothetical protein U5N86_00430 [Planctomycetota bacterium]|nr:hypothetical protein [Planctomycetota bacterium]
MDRRKAHTKLLEDEGLTDEWNGFVTAYRDITDNQIKAMKGKLDPGRGFRLPAVKRIQSDPFALEPVSGSISDLAYENVSERDYSALIRELAKVLEYEPGKTEKVKLSSDEPEALLNEIANVLNTAGMARDQAFAQLSEKEVKFLYGQSPNLCRQMVKHIYIHAYENTLQANLTLLNLQSKVDFDSLYRGAAILSSLFMPENVEHMTKVFSQKRKGNERVNGVDGKVLVSAESNYGPLLVGGKYKNSYAGAYAFIFDLGGEDTYKDQGAARKGQTVSVVLDAGGDDTYTGGDFATAGALAGYGMILDLLGKRQLLWRLYVTGFRYVRSRFAG